ncbi:MAG: type II toxin-antitoxin system RelE/ParE family toxin [Deltaproteobacteria bacterium]|nr:type II toxin-antitoxin system RelE/ParE family toxin [Deltaproteobacteria bacterium]
MWSLVYTKSARKTLSKLASNVRTRILAKLEHLAKDPFAQSLDVKRLTGTATGYRLRSGDWRVIYDLDEGELRVLVIKIGARGDVYKC